MNNPEDCPEKSNNSAVAAFVDEADAERLTKEARINQHARLAAKWQSDTQPKALADNGERLHTRNRQALREAGAIVDEFRAGEGRDAYNRKQREAYAANKGSAPRAYVNGLSEEERAERDRIKNAEAQARSRLKKSVAQQSAERAERRRKKRERDAEAAELEAIAREAVRKTF